MTTPSTKAGTIQVLSHRIKVLESLLEGSKNQQTLTEELYLAVNC